jgi:molecular chaperone GrpE
VASDKKQREVESVEIEKSGSEPAGKDPDGTSKRKLTKKDILKLLAVKNRKIEELTEESAGFEAEATEFKDKWLRSVAEFENYRKRTRKEWDLLQRQLKGEVILEILNVVDDFERAFTVVGDRDDDVVQGIRLIYNNLISSLDRIGVQKIDAMDSSFDPAYHMAVAQIDKEGAHSNNVVEIVQEGYLLGDTVVRPAKVIIAK